MKRVVLRNIILLLLIILGGTVSSAYSADQDTIRIRIGLKLFRAILAADTQIDSKQGAGGKLALAIIYNNDKQQADLYARLLQELGKGKKQSKIKGIPTVVHVIATHSLEQLSVQQYAGLYVVEDLENSVLQQLVDYGIGHHIISYSPYPEAVEQGISAGLMIGARVRPYVNLLTLKRSQLQIKPFFLKVSKQYEP